MVRVMAGVMFRIRELKLEMGFRLAPGPRQLQHCPSLASASLQRVAALVLSLTHTDSYFDTMLAKLTVSTLLLF